MLSRNSGLGTWGQRLLTPSAGSPAVYFGGRLVLDGDRLFVSAIHTAKSSGQVYVYRLQEGEPTLAHVLKLGDAHGEAMDPKGNLLAVGSYGRQSREGTSLGSVDFFEESNGEWAWVGSIEAPKMPEGHRFVHCHWLGEDHLFVGSVGGGGKPGNAFLFARRSEHKHDWEHVGTVVGTWPDSVTGRRVAFNGEELLVSEYSPSQSQGKILVCRWEWVD